MKHNSVIKYPDPTKFRNFLFAKQLTMNAKSTLAAISLSSFLFSNVIAQEPISRKKPLYLSFEGGYVANTVFGSIVNFENTNGNAPRGLHMRDGGGITLQAGIQKYFSEYLFFKTGLQYIHRKVNPESGTYLLYQDSLNTGYLSIPVMVGINALPVSKSSLNLSFEFGPVFNFAAIKKSKVGPDRVGFSTYPVSISLSPGVLLSWATSPTQRILVHYSYVVDITNAYKEPIYPRDYYYKYKSNVFSFVFQVTIP